MTSLLESSIIEDVQPIADRPAAGAGEVEVSRVAGQSTITTQRANSPLKLLCPRAKGLAVWVYACSYGGGLVAGDRLSLTVNLQPRTRMLLSTQSSTKVYKSGGGSDCRQSLRASVEDGALLMSLPDPVCCFADADYVQHQRFELASGASLLMLDWFTSGRRARGERWAFTRYRSRNVLIVDQKLVTNDALLLDRADGPIDAPFRMGRFECYATLLMIGPMLWQFAEATIKEIAADPVVKRASLIAAASPIAGGVLLRILGPGQEAVADFLRPRLACVKQLLGDDALGRKW